MFAGVHACVRACACACMRVHILTERSGYKLYHGAVNKLYHIIYLSFRISIYLSSYIYLNIYARTHTHTYIPFETYTARDPFAIFNILIPYEIAQGNASR